MYSLRFGAISFSLFLHFSIYIIHTNERRKLSIFYLPHHIPLMLIINCIREAIAHLAHLSSFFRTVKAFDLVYPDPIVFPGKINDQCVKGRGNIMKPLLITFPYKCLAHNFKILIIIDSLIMLKKLCLS